MIDVLLKKSCEWMEGQGPDADIVLTTRLRIARNLKGILFPHKADIKTRNRVFSIIEEAVKESMFLQGSIVLRMDKLDELDRLFLLERRLISRETISNPIGSGVIIGQKEMVSIMINEEDHLRMQILLPGFQLPEVWRMGDQIDTELEKGLDYAYSPTLGYLTACPTNVGTGIRASVMVHLPALVLAKQIEQVIQAVMKLGLAVRGIYGEGSEASGSIFQISNQVTLGKSEIEIINNLEGVIRQIVSHERNARKLLLKNKRRPVEDRVARAYGLLKYARTMSSKEATNLLSALRMGIDLAILKDVDRKVVNELFIIIQPAHLQKMARKKLGPADRDILRADLIREKLGEKKGRSRKPKTNSE